MNENITPDRLITAEEIEVRELRELYYEQQDQITQLSEALTLILKLLNKKAIIPPVAE